MTKPVPLTPHGKSFSFIDTCDVFEADKRALGSKWLDPKSSFFEGHFPGRPLMPGVLLVECAAQTAGVLWQIIDRDESRTPLFLAQVGPFRFLKSVLPGQTIRIEVVLEKELGSLAQFAAMLWVGHDMVAQGAFALSRNQKESS